MGGRACARGRTPPWRRGRRRGSGADAAWRPERGHARRPAATPRTSRREGRGAALARRSQGAQRPNRELMPDADRVAAVPVSARAPRSRLRIDLETPATRTRPREGHAFNCQCSKVIFQWCSHTLTICAICHVARGHAAFWQ